jgi:Domain of unknown function (DUF4962)/Heparinase II/III-like protein
MRLKHFSQIVILFLISAAFSAAAAPKLNEKPAQPGDWGYRPAQGAVERLSPPPFSWRPMKGMKWELQVAKDKQFNNIAYTVSGVEYNVHCPPRTLKPGEYTWRYRGHTSSGTTNWSRPRTFQIDKSAKNMPLPPREELLSRIPKSHPRLFMRPENLDKLKSLAHSDLGAQYQKLMKQSDKILKNPPDTSEPPKYPKSVVRKDETWRKIWWGNRGRVQKSLGQAATLGFTWLLSGEDKYGQAARHILMECAKWDPHGATGYRYNDEAGMPYAYYFARTYTFINPLLSEKEKAICRSVAKVRGREMYNHLCPRHFWRPYNSHANRAWHFLGELGIAFQDEVEGADEWAWFAANVFFNCYPVWSDDNGGWHEGSAYWSSYQSRFTWWADVMREAMGINAFDKPYYSQTGYYAMYLMPPGKVGGGFGDQTARLKSTNFLPLCSVFAAQAQNPHWQWYVEEQGGPKNVGDYVGFIRGALPKVTPKPPVDLPASRLFGGIGQAMLNTTLQNSADNVQIVFKSSPFGTQSHGYEANNSFLLSAYGKRLLIRSGKRDIYGSEHHVNWMWSTRSVNNITINGGQGQTKHSSAARGEITLFQTTPEIDIVRGEAGKAHPGLERYTRTIIFAKPDLFVVFDQLKAKKPSTFEYCLHAISKMEVAGQHHLEVVNGDVGCDVNFLVPTGLTFKQTDQYDPNPRPRVKLREWHLTASTPNPKTDMEFVTVYRPYRKKDAKQLTAEVSLQKTRSGYQLKAALSNGGLEAFLPIDGKAALRAKLTRKGNVLRDITMK